MTTRTLPFALALILAACTYDPPPQVSLGGPSDRRYPVGDPIPVLFSEPVVASSVSIAVWPGEKSAYDIEGEPLADTAPIVEGCTLATSPCGEGGGLTLVLDEARTTLTLDVAAGLFGDPGRPLLLEVAGTLEDDAGRKARAVQRFPFQIVSDVPVTPDTVGGDTDQDAEAKEPIVTAEGPFLFFAEFDPPPVPLAQQFFIDIQVDESNGHFYALMIDADPVADADKNTSNPDELFLDKGAEGFIFVTHGTIFREDDGGLAYVGEPFDLHLTIGPISFALIQAVIRGRINVDEDTGLTRWDGLMSVERIDFDSGSVQKQYTEADGLKPATFQILELKPEQVPDTMAYTCDADPCPDDVQVCDLLPDQPWPPAAVCPAE